MLLAAGERGRKNSCHFSIVAARSAVHRTAATKMIPKDAFKIKVSLILGKRETNVSARRKLLI